MKFLRFYFGKPKINLGIEWWCGVGSDIDSNLSNHWYFGFTKFGKR